MSFSCPQCKARTSVVDSRPLRQGVRRRRHCPACSHTTYTIEVATDAYPRKNLTALQAEQQAAQDSLLSLLAQVRGDVDDGMARLALSIQVRLDEINEKVDAAKDSLTHDS